TFLEVEKLKKLFLLIFTLVFIFSFDVRALADEGHSHNPNLDSGTDMEGMDHGSGNEMEGSSGEAHNHQAPVVEVPPNYKVLGTYGAVNLSFILIGIWNKWFRRKGDVNNGNA
ncbi:MAG: hypothetical protein ACJ8MO_43500, partial [Bacillus sp. (in: firmicutes)]